MKYTRFMVRRCANNMYALHAQNNDTLNWDCVSGYFDNLVRANDFAKFVAQEVSKENKCYTIAYGLGGYSIGRYLNGEVYNK